MTKKTAAKTAETKAVSEDTTLTDRVSDGAREMVKRTASSTKERTDTFFENGQKYNADLENFLIRAARGYVNVLGSIADAAQVNVNRGIATAEKLAEAKSISDAMQIQSEYVREQTTCSMNNARSAMEYVRDVVTENGTALRDTTTKMWRSDKAA
ncbi:MAG: phasin family protein [Pseudomonadota bacterium]